MAKLGPKAGPAIKDMSNPGSLTKKQMFGMSVTSGVTAGILANQANTEIARKRIDRYSNNLKGHIHRRHQGAIAPVSPTMVMYNPSQGGVK